MLRTRLEREEIIIRCLNWFRWLPLVERYLNRRSYYYARIYAVCINCEKHVNCKNCIKFMVREDTTWLKPNGKVKFWGKDVA